eukprot:622288-Pyramimonas_sp.AAC.1
MRIWHKISKKWVPLQAPGDPLRVARLRCPQKFHRGTNAILKSINRRSSAKLRGQSFLGLPRGPRRRGPGGDPARRVPPAEASRDDPGPGRQWGGPRLRWQS